MGIRRKARELALNALYSFDVCFHNEEEVKNIFLDKEDDGLIKEFSSQIINGVFSNLNQIDKNITKIAKNWDIDRMASVDKAILRMAVYEIIYMEDIPYNVSINEAVELAKKYSTIVSSKFVNGILDKIKKQGKSNA